MAEHLETQVPVRVSRIDIDEARAAVEALGEINIPAELRDHLALFVRLERKVLREYDEDICNIFDNPGEEAAGDPTNEQGIPTTQSATADAFRDAIELIDSLSLDRAQIIVRAFTTFFHLANLSEENYRVETLRKRESRVSIDSAVDPVNELTVADRQMIDEVGEDKANELLARLEFHPSSRRIPPRPVARRSRARSAASPVCWRSARAWAAPTLWRTSAIFCRR